MKIYLTKNWDKSGLANILNILEVNQVYGQYTKSLIMKKYMRS